ncbi:MAG: FRG domain-containing protein [Alphaproteobacteria bacterium]|nr:FRG domain-containing protein [Alphaproteobacteria bacterium]
MSSHIEAYEKLKVGYPDLRLVDFEYSQASGISLMQKYLAEFFTDDEPRLFRGQPSAEHLLVPSIYRNMKSSKSIDDFVKVWNLVKRQDRMIEQFRERYTGADLTNLPHWHVAAVARHYGLPTILLDWTKNSLIALFFACSDAFEVTLSSDQHAMLSLEESGFGAVWSYPFFDGDQASPEDLNQKFSSFSGMKVFKPNSRFSRIFRQSAFASVYAPSSFDPIASTGFHIPLPDRGVFGSRICHAPKVFLIPNTLKRQVLGILFKFGIRWSTLFEGEEYFNRDLVLEALLQLSEDRLPTNPGVVVDIPS